VTGRTLLQLAGVVVVAWVAGKAVGRLLFGGARWPR
jgi:hypothetical protein